MNSQGLNRLSFKQLEKIANKFDVPRSSDKFTLAENIVKRYNDVKKYKSYTYIKQLGHEGKDGKTYLAEDKDGSKCAIKIFKDSKSSKSIVKEARLQSIAASEGISPRVYDYDGDGKFIVMEKLDTNLYDLFVEQEGCLTVPQQKSIVKLFIRLDECKVFHADPNPLNFMMKNGRWYIIDFGFAKPINTYTIHKYGQTPNIKYMPLGLKVKLQSVYKDVELKYIDKYC